MKDINENLSAVAEDLSNKVANTFALAEEMSWSYENLNTVAAEMVAGIFSTNAPTKKYLENFIELVDETVRNCYEKFIEYSTQQMWDLAEETSLFFQKQSKFLMRKNCIFRHAYSTICYMMTSP